jgi:excisionase family DNA binding protein
MNENSNHYLTISQAAHLVGVTRQAIYISVKSGRLKSFRMGYKWLVTAQDLEKYREELYSRVHSRRSDGALLFDPEKDEYSIKQVAEMADCSVQRVYYLIRTNQLKSTRVGSAYIVQIPKGINVINLINSLYVNAAWVQD